jgi:hypothetical protein
MASSATSRRGARHAGGDHPVMEFLQTMPDDDLAVADGARLDPLTCELTTAYVSAIAN